MFSGELNPRQHRVIRGHCTACKRAFPQDGIVYTKEDVVLAFVPDNYTLCKGVNQWQKPS